MKSTTPGPGWLYDPDDAASERYWDGSAWTEFRRARQSVAERPQRDPSSFVEPLSTDRRDTQTPNQADGVPVPPSRIPWMASASLPTSSAVVPEPRREERRPQFVGMTPISGSAVQVVRGVDHLGQVGVVVRIMGDALIVRFDGKAEVHVVMRDAVQMVSDPEDASPEPIPPLRSALWDGGRPS